MVAKLARSLLVAFLLPLAVPAALHAQPFIEHVSPPVVERGKTTRVTFVGRGLARASDVWHSLPANALNARAVESSATQAVFEMTIASDAPVGVCGLRAATPDGLSNLHLLLVDDLPVKPGAAGGTPQALTKPAAVWGFFREGSVDRYQLDVKAGESLGLEVVANRFGKDADPLLVIRDEAGRFVAERDNDPGLYFDSRFNHTFATAGTFTLELREARFKGSEHWPYVLRVGRFPCALAAVPAAVTAGRNAIAVGTPASPRAVLEVPTNRLPGPFFASLKRDGDDGSAWAPVALADGPVTVANESSEPTAAVVPGSLCGTLRTPGQKQIFAFKWEKGQRLFFRGEARAINSPAELELSLRDGAGKELKRGTETKGSDEVSLDFTAPAAGAFQLVVRDGLRDGGDSFAYRLTARAEPFPPHLVADVEGLVIPQGSYQPVPIAVTRSPGGTGPITLKLLGAPPGVTLTPTEIAEGENAIVCKLEASPTAAPGVHSVQILAETAGPSVTSRTLVTTQPLVDRKFVNADLVPLALREDQRRLPPSVTDRFAVQVTPASPFTFELLEPALALVRYQRVSVPIITTRVPGFDGPITFTAEGGQLAPKEEGRTRVYAEFPTATPDRLRMDGHIQSLILSNLAKSRIDVSATGTHRGRRVKLTRTFDLELIAAFKVKAEPAKVSVLPGETVRARVVVERVGGFDHAVTVRFSPNMALTLPEQIVIGKGETGAEFSLAIPADFSPRKLNLQVTSASEVNGYEEEVRGSLLEIDVRKPDAPKKK